MDLTFRYRTGCLWTFPAPSVMLREIEAQKHASNAPSLLLLTPTARLLLQESLHGLLVDSEARPLVFNGGLCVFFS